MAIADDISVDINGNFRWTGAAATTYTVLQFHRYIGALMDDAQASGDDLLDIVSETASERSTDQIITLNSPYNIDDTLAEHLYDGSISQNNGDDLYSGLRVVGTVEAGTEPVIVQDGKVLPAYWGAGINADAANLVIMRILVKSRSGGADIDGKKVLVRAGELGDSYAEFPVTLGQANSVAAISSVDDINNNTADATIAGWTTIASTEGFQLIDIDGDSTGEEYFTKWDKGSQSLNDVYEYSKWIQQRAHIADNGTDTGSNFVVDNATILGQGQEFTARATTEKLVEARFRLKIGGGTPTGTLVAELYDSDDVATGAPTGAVLATSEPVLTSRLTSTYAETIFRFNGNVTLTANQAYFIVIRNAAGDGTNFVHVEGLATSGAHAGNRAEDTGTWAGVAADDLWFTVKSSPVIHGRAGELMRGITHEVVYDTEAGGPFTENEILFWGTQIPYDGIAGGPFQVGEYIKINLGAGAVKVGGKVLKQTATRLWVTLDLLTGGLILDNDDITGLKSGATAKVNLPAVTGNGTDDLDFTTGANTIDRTAGSFVTDGFEVGHKIDVTGSASNNGKLTITAVAALQLTVAETLTTELNVAATLTVDVRDDTSAGGEGVLLALDDNGTTGDFYIQLISGSAPVDNLPIEGRSSGATADVNVTVNARPLQSVFLGQSTGTNLIGAYGIGFDTADVGASDKFTDLTNTLRTPPNNVTMTVTGLVSGEDRVLVGPRTAGALQKNQMTLNTTLSGATETAVVLTAAIPSETPSEGNTSNSRIRVQLDTGVYRRQAYDSFTGSTFTIPSTDYSGANAATAPRDVFVAYIDVLADATSEAFTAVYTADRDLLLRVRDGGGTPIKTIENPITFGSSSFSTAIVRQSDA